MTARLSAALWSATSLLVLALLVRNTAAITVLAPLDPNEGWNAAHTLLLLTTGTPYPPSNRSTTAISEGKGAGPRPK